jgi:hypothetical protein
MSSQCCHLYVLKVSYGSIQPFLSSSNLSRYLLNDLRNCILLSHVPTSWKEAKVITLPKRGNDPIFPLNLRPVNLQPRTRKFLEKVILKIVQRYIAKCKPVWIACRSQHDIAMYEDNGPHKPYFSNQCLRLQYSWTST